MENIDIVIPRLGLTMEWGRVVQWFFKEGEEVKQGQPLFALETEKATVDVEAQDSGKLHILPELMGEELPVGTIIGYFELIDNTIGTAEKPSESSERKEEFKQISSTMVIPTQVLPATPIKEHRPIKQPEETIATVLPGQVLGAIKNQTNVGLSSLQAQKLHPTFEQQIASLSGIRQIIAKHMSDSAHTTAPVTLTIQVDATALVQFREQVKMDVSNCVGTLPSYNDMFILLVGKAIQKFPQINASLTNQGIVEHKEINIGLAVDTPRGLLVPVIRKVQSKKLIEIASETRRLAESAQNGNSLPDDLHGGTFTITNLGKYEIDAFTPIINLPECAILGIGSISPQAVVMQERKIEIREMLVLSLTFDHRVIDGAPAARFLQYLKHLIEKPVDVLTS